MNVNQKSGSMNSQPYIATISMGYTAKHSDIGKGGS